MKKLSNESLKPGLGFGATVSLVIGTVIGTGIFLKAAVMTQATGSFTWVMLAWIAAGVLSLCGALCFAELGSRFPHAGGEYVYLREAFGELPAFLNGWMRFTIGNPGSIAAYAVGLMTFMNGIFQFSEATQTFWAVIVIVLFTLINCATVRAAGLLQSYMTALKLTLIFGLTAAIVLYRPTDAPNALVVSTEGWPGWKAFGAAMLAALWAYDGWNGMPMAAGEVKEPQKNIPRALIGGMTVIILIYIVANFAFFASLSFDEIITSSSPAHPSALPVATKAALHTLGGTAVAFVSLILAFSAVVSLNGSILTGARVPFAMARDGVFFKQLGQVHRHTRTPVVAVLIQGLIAIAIACSGTFDQLTDYVIFASWVFYALAIVALFVLRRNSKTPLVFKVPGYPWIPLAFLCVSLWLIINTLMTSPVESLIGLAIISAGMPLYLLFKRR